MTLFLTLVLPIFGAALLAGMQALFGRRKTGAETTDVITQAAERVLNMAATDNARLRLQVEGLITHVAVLEARVSAQDRRITELEAENAILLRRLAAWDPTEPGGGPPADNA